MTTKNKKQNLHEFEETEDSYSPNQNFKIKMGEPHSPTMKEGFNEVDDGSDLPEGSIRILDREGKAPLIHFKPVGIEKQTQNNFFLLEDTRNGINLQVSDRKATASELSALCEVTHDRILKKNLQMQNKISKLKKSFYGG